MFVRPIRRGYVNLDPLSAVESSKRDVRPQSPQTDHRERRGILDR